MPSAKIYFQMDVSLPGGTIQSFGSKNVPAIVNLDNSAPELFQDRVTIANNGEATLATFGSGADLPSFKIVLLKPSVTMYAGWRGSNSDADNSIIELRAGVWQPLLNDSTTAYNATSLTRIDNATTAYDISAIIAGNRSGGSGYIDIVALY